MCRCADVYVCMCAHGALDRWYWSFCMVVWGYQVVANPTRPSCCAAWCLYFAMGLCCVGSTGMSIIEDRTAHLGRVMRWIVFVLFLVLHDVTFTCLQMVRMYMIWAGCHTCGRTSLGTCVHICIHTHACIRACIGMQLCIFRCLHMHALRFTLQTLAFAHIRTPTHKYTHLST